MSTLALSALNFLAVGLGDKARSSSFGAIGFRAQDFMVAAEKGDVNCVL